MDKHKTRISPLARVEMEALEAGREWTRRKIQRDLQKLADQQGDLSPLNPPDVDPHSPPSDQTDDQRR